jgi:hypothetical protein
MTRKATTIRDLTPTEQAAIDAFAAHFGRSWKRKLAEVYWYNARVFIDHSGIAYPSLHALRNDPSWGHVGLQRYRAPKPKS